MEVVLYEPSLVLKDACLYDTLQIPRTATTKDIKDAYRRIAIKFHPDKNPNNVAALEYFKEVSRANAILTNSIKKDIYDKHGAYGLEIGNTYGDHNVDSYFLVTSTWYSIKNRFTSIFTLYNVALSMFAAFGFFMCKPRIIDDKNSIV